MSGNLSLGSEAMNAYSSMVEYREADYVIFKAEGSAIVPENYVPVSDSGEYDPDDQPDPDRSPFDEFLAALPADECRWGICLADLGSYGSLCSDDPVLYTWLPAAAPASQKALYEQNTAVLARAFDLVQISHSAADHAGLSHGAVLDRLAVSGPPRALHFPDGDISFGRFAPKAEEIVMDIRRDSEAEVMTFGHAIFKMNRFFLLDVAQTGDPGAPHEEFLAGLPADDCRWGVYTLDISDLTDTRSTFTFFFTWIPQDAPEKTRRLYESGSDGTAMGAFEAAEFSPTGRLAGKFDQAIDYFLSTVSDHSAVSRENFHEKARRIFKPTEGEKMEDYWAEKKFRDEARAAEQEAHIIEGEAEEGGLYR
ncbi:hypothetical protein FDA94_01000 [Herbidospora galbida]|uniref:ADF-H domain-containing protein n=1 Tax=Herbidospora galbida TaxID=2575442 RepID=A0A4U3MP76_9ACTN|nr:hypothetical protein [Herbidospora galbida]TKK91405.1 hypothetical protein FDA94_01000 [Herbidospora galbida]